MSSFINSGAGLVLSIWFVLALVLNRENIFYICKAYDLGVVFIIGCGVAIMSPQIVYRCLLTSHLHVYRCLLTSHLHDKAAELCLANSRNNRVSATKYNSIHSAVPRHALLWVSFYCDVITKSCLQLINTLIDTFFSKLCAFLAEQRRRKAIDS